MARKYNSRGKGRGKKEKKVFPLVEGRVQMTREGYAFVIVEGEEDDVFVKASKTVVLSMEIPCVWQLPARRQTVSAGKARW